MMRIAVAWMLVALLGIIGCKPTADAPPAPRRPVVSEILSPRAGLQHSYVGTIAPSTETNLGFPLAGTLAVRPVEEGDIVEKGATLARLDPQQLEAQLRSAQAGVTVATAQLNSARDAADRVNALVAKGVNSPSTAENTRRALVAAEARLAQAQAAAAQARQLLAFATLTAPRDGVITHIYAHPGAALSAGQKVVQLAATREREALVDLSEQDAAGLEPGAVFRVTLEAAPEISTTATLHRIDPVANPTTRTRRLHLTLTADPADAFRLGALVQVAPDAQTRARLTLPLTALIGGKPAVWIIAGEGKDRKAHRTDVTLGAEIGGRVVVTNGLQTGEEVVLKGVNSIEEGQIVGPSVSQ